MSEEGSAAIIIIAILATGASVLLFPVAFGCTPSSLSSQLITTDTMGNVKAYAPTNVPLSVFPVSVVLTQMKDVLSFTPGTCYRGMVLTLKLSSSTGQTNSTSQPFASSLSSYRVLSVTVPVTASLSSVSFSVSGSLAASTSGSLSFKQSSDQVFNDVIGTYSLTSGTLTGGTGDGVSQVNQTTTLRITTSSNNVTTYQFSSTSALTSFATQTIVTSTTSSLVVSCPSGTVYDGSGCVSEQPITAPVSVTLTIKLACPTGDTLHQYHFGELYNCATPSGAYVPLIDAPLPSGTAVTAALYTGYTSNIVTMPSVTPASQTLSTDASGTILLKFTSVTVGSGFSPALGTDVQLSPTIGLAFSLNGTSYGGSNLISFQFPLPIQSSYTATLTVTPGGQLGA